LEYSTELLTYALEKNPTQISDVAIDTDNRVILAGYCPDDEQRNDFCFTRHLPSGEIDKSFGENGMIKTPFSTEGDDAVSKIVMLKDGKFLALGTTFTANAVSFALVRYAP